MASGRVSVVIPTRDRPAALAHALHSALGQTHRPLEVIVVDDGEHPASVPEGGPVRVVRRQGARGDAGAARNLGVAEARGELIAFLDDDDVWHSDKLARQLDVLGDAPATCCGFEIVDGRGRVVERHLPAARDLRRELLLRPVLQPSGLLVRRDALDRVRGFPEGRPRCEDWALFLRLADDGPVVSQAEVLVTRAPSQARAEEKLAAIRSLYDDEIAPRIAPSDRAPIQAHHRLIQGVLLAQTGRRREAAPLLWRSSARWQVLRLVTGERAWAALRRATRRAHRRGRR